MALALYRTYRPGSLAEVIGQEHVTAPLARALDAGRVHHAYLFSGPRGCGKTSTARILARSLNCADGPTAAPCGSCRSCVELAPNGPGSIDVVELDAATNRGVDDARVLREKAVYAPVASRYKVYIIDEAHQLTSDAANALLKLIEEPPAHLRFIFATTEPDKIIPTIRSRTFHYGFRLVGARTLSDHLAAVCRAEGVPADGPALAVVARAGAGSVRDSLSVLGQLLSGAGPQGLTYADAVAALGLTDASVIDAFVDALAEGSPAAMFTVVDAVISAGHDPRRFLTDVLERLRDLIIVRADPSALDSGLVDVPDAVGERLVTQAQSLGLAELSRAADQVSVGLSEVRGATAPRLQLELLCARLAQSVPGEDLTALRARLDRLERALAALGRSPSPAGTAGADAAPVRTSGVTPVPAAAAPGDDSGGGPPGEGPPAGMTAGQQSAGQRTPQARTAQSGTTAAPSPPRRPDLRTRPEPPAAVGPPAPPGRPVPAPAQQPTQAPAATAPTAATPVGSDPPAATAPSAGSGQALGQVRAAWPSILEALSRVSRVAWTAFAEATPVSFSGGALAVAVPDQGKAAAIASRGHDERLRQVLIDVLGLDATIDILHDPGATAGGAARPAGSEGSAGTSPGPTPGGPTPGSPVGTRGAQSERAGSAAAAVGSGRAAGPDAGRSGVPGASGGNRATARGVDLVRAAASQPEPDGPDEPSEDDPDLESAGIDGIALITRELGGRPIGEIDHS